MDINEAIQHVLDAHAKELAAATTTQAVQQLTPGIVKDFKKSYTPRDDAFAYRAVIIILGIVVILVAGTCAWYSLTPDPSHGALRPLPDALIALGSASLGALAG